MNGCEAMQLISGRSHDNDSMENGVCPDYIHSTHSYYIFSCREAIFFFKISTGSKFLNFRCNYMQVFFKI